MNGMKSPLLTLALLFLMTSARAQNINWKRLENGTPQYIQLTAGYDYGFTAQLGYTRLVSLYRPIALGIELSMPMGSTVFDDFKVRFGGQVNLVERAGFALSARVMSNFRRYQNMYVRSVGFGADLGAIAGYYSNSWHANAEFGFDKAITTNLQHSDLLKSDYAQIENGWYVPTGGHYYYGVQAGKTLDTSLDISLRVGETRAQFDDKNAVLPYYFQLGLGKRF
jgi:hypothetical protein